MNSLMSYAEFHAMLAQEYSLDFELLETFLSSCPDGPVLDVGAGGGRSLRCRTSKEIVLIDNVYCETLKQTLVEFPGKAQFVLAEAYKIPLDDESYSGAFYLANSLGEMQPILFTLAEAHRLLKLGGKIFFFVTNPCLKFDSYIPKLKKFATNKGAHLSYRIEVGTDTRFNDYGYESRLRISSNGFDSDFKITQTFPPLEIWTHLLARIGFSVDTVVGDYSGAQFNEESSDYIVVTAIKDTAEPSIQEPSLNSAKILYDKISGDYENIMKETSYQVPDFVAELAHDWSATFPRVLDLACGTGMVGKKFFEANTGAKVFGIDFAPGMVEFTRASGFYQSVACATVDSKILSIDQSFYDICTAFGLFEFCDQAEEVISSVCKAIVVGGEMWTTFELSHQDSLPSGTFDPKVGIAKFHYTVNQVQALLDKAGLDVLDLSVRKAYTSFSYKRDIENIFVRAKKRAKL